jgi:hypothetical protein
MIEGPEGIHIVPQRLKYGTTRFSLTATGSPLTLVFRPRCYQKHKNIPYFQPWTHQARKDSITGCMLMLSDKPEGYQDERNLAGLRHSAPGMIVRGEAQRRSCFWIR